MGIFRTITSRIARIIQGFDEIFTPSADNPLQLFALVKQSQAYVKNKTGQTPTVLLYSPTLKKIIAACEGVLASELGIIVRKEPRLPNDQLMLVLDGIDAVLVSPNEDAFVSFLDRADSTVGIVIGDVEPDGDAGDAETYDDSEEYGGTYSDPSGY